MLHSGVHGRANISLRFIYLHVLFPPRHKHCALPAIEHDSVVCIDILLVFSIAQQRLAYFINTLGVGDGGAEGRPCHSFGKRSPKITNH